MPVDTKGVKGIFMEMLLSVLGLIMNMRNSFGKSDSESYEERAREFRNYWLDPNYSYLNSDSKDLFGSKFDYQV